MHENRNENNAQYTLQWNVLKVKRNCYTPKIAECVQLFCDRLLVSFSKVQICIEKKPPNILYIIQRKISSQKKNNNTILMENNAKIFQSAYISNVFTFHLFSLH